MTTMIERVRDAIDKALEKTGDADIKAGLAYIDLVPIARAAIMAMREPDVETIKRAHMEPTAAGLAYYGSLIDAALEGEA